MNFPPKCFPVELPRARFLPFFYFVHNQRFKPPSQKQGEKGTFPLFQPTNVPFTLTLQPLTENPKSYRNLTNCSRFNEPIKIT